LPTTSPRHRPPFPTRRSSDLRRRYIIAIRRALEEERTERASATEINAPVIEVMSDENAETDKDVRAPRAYRRLKPPYPETAARADRKHTSELQSRENLVCRLL